MIEAFLPNTEINEFQGRGANFQFVVAILKLLLDLPFMGIWANRASVLVEFYRVLCMLKKVKFYFRDNSALFDTVKET